MMPSSKAKKGFAASLLIAFSFVISLILGEAVVRMVFDRVDYLEAYLVDDDIVGHKIAARSAGHDFWGFRNKSVPASAKIVAIGDSQTYGISATAKNSWPAQLQKIIRQEVYNLSLGGYGPVEYYYLLQNKALELRPSLIIVGFYFGNDLFDAYRSVYTRDYWKWLRRSDFFLQEEKQLDDNDSDSGTHKFMGSFRDWLAHHSVLYRMFTFSFGNLFRFLEMKYASSPLNSDIAILEDEQRGIRTGFTPLTRLSVLNLQDPRVEEGLRLTLEVIRRMNDLCSEKSIQFIVALIPTKESVFADYIGHEREFKNSSELIANERKINQFLKKSFTERNIPYVDVLPDLRGAVPKKIPYFANVDGHPNADGYEVIAKSVSRFLMDFNRRRGGALAD
jgi:lysophospholipase L1-like esterase